MNRIIRVLAVVLAASFAISLRAVSADPPKRPQILGVAHMAIYAKDLAKTRQFYEDFLGFGEPFTLPKKGGEGVRIAFVRGPQNVLIEILDRDVA